MQPALPVPLDHNAPIVPVQDKGVLNGFFAGKPMFASVDVYLDESRPKVVADAGSLLWMDSGIEMQTGIVGSCCDGYWRSLAGESCCQNTYTGTGKVGLGFVLPGDMVHFLVTKGKDNGWMLSPGAFICGSPNTQVTAKWGGCCAGQMEDAAFLTVVRVKEGEEGPGSFFAGGYGGINRHIIEAGNSLIIDNGLFFATSSKGRLRVTWFGSSLTSCAFGGEQLGMIFQGPAVVYTQNRDPSIFKPPVDNSDGSSE